MNNNDYLVSLLQHKNVINESLEQEYKKLDEKKQKLIKEYYSYLSMKNCNQVAKEIMEEFLLFKYNQELENLTTPFYNYFSGIFELLKDINLKIEQQFERLESPVSVVPKQKVRKSKAPHVA